MRNNFKYPKGATPLDSDEIDELKLKFVVTREELNRWEQDNINDALDWIKKHRQGEVLTEKFIKTLHQKMFGKVWRWAGKFRQSGKNIGVDHHKITIALHSLLEDVKYWIKEKTYPEDEIAVRFHHKLVWIHLFPNGNGRHARLMADILLAEKFSRKPFNWSGQGTGDEDNIRECYLKALRKADGGDYSLLLKFVR